ncbi:MAG: S-methyl-5-thioribose-1-phosphate isomerase, partial [Methyloligellaceae bacterium]
MKIDGTHTRTIWVDDNGWTVHIIDQTKLPHLFETKALKSCGDAADAITNMLVRGAPLIGATAAYGICLALREDASDENLETAAEELMATRPTAVNLRWAIDEMMHTVRNLPREKRVIAAYARAGEICDEDVETCRMIGVHGLKLIEKIA